MSEAQYNLDGDDTQLFLEQLRGGHESALGSLLERYRDRLRRIVRFRMDPRLTSRIEADDVVQETFLEVMQRIGTYVSDPQLPVFVWVRYLALQKLMGLHRYHLLTQARDAGREIRLGHGPLSGATSADLAAKLLGSQTSPSHALMRVESKMRLEQALNSMEELDREVLTLRHFEQLSNLETAQVLDLTPTAASNRYVRAVKRLKESMDQFGDSSIGFFR